MSLGQHWACPGLSAGYHLADVNDFSGNSKTLTNNGTVTFGPGRLGNCAELGSSNSSKYLSRTDGLSIDLSGNCGFSCWIFLQANPASTKRCRILDWRSTTGTGRWFTLDYYNNSGTYQISWYPNTTSAIDFNYTFSLNAWYKIDVELNGSTAYLYINGALIRSDARGTHSNSTNKTVIGAESAATAGFFFFGNIDEFVFFTVNRTAADIRRRYAFGRGMLV